MFTNVYKCPILRLYKQQREQGKSKIEETMRLKHTDCTNRVEYV